MYVISKDSSKLSGSVELLIKCWFGFVVFVCRPCYTSKLLSFCSLHIHIIRTHHPFATFGTNKLPLRALWKHKMVDLSLRVDDVSPPLSLLPMIVPNNDPKHVFGVLSRSVMILSLSCYDVWFELCQKAGSSSCFTKAASFKSYLN